MSTKTWKAERYSVSAEDAVAKRWSAVRLIDHCLLKWRGLREKVLARHGLRATHLGDITDGREVFCIDADSCALCEKFLVSEVGRCRKCPLAQSRGGVPCDKVRRGAKQAPWYAWTSEQNPEPMIAALVRARKYVKGWTK